MTNRRQKSKTLINHDHKNNEKNVGLNQQQKNSDSFASKKSSVISLNFETNFIVKKCSKLKKMSINTLICVHFYCFDTNLFIIAFGNNPV